MGLSPKNRTKPTARVGPYDVYGIIGEGNYGCVKRGVNRLNAREYAIKIIDRRNLSPNEQRPEAMDIRREMSLLRCLDHPYIVQLHDVMASKDRIYLVMECAHGGDLYHYIARNGKLSESEARKYFRQLVYAVDYCHQKGVYHRDLKPENLLLSADGNLKVTDFGFSAMKDHTRCLLRASCGSPHYCAPEVWNRTQRAGYDGSKSDAFSVGVVLYVFLCGVQPFYDESERRLLRKVNQCEVTYPGFLSSEAQDLLSKLIVKDPARRWSLRKVQRHPWFI
eukprot:Plantae.Rhodophyta-Hildenbrandia_rubra.ctg4351.p1 GENE.Plantae.Rhodophyta-Hildenbrandia_rubra.ctg4351~~Plantae.Rhodophyta-Hildenbrandia_rubra.ctg4351.p1  ORF type:complete len:279 (+),score=14.84 Plantae.Rhodophyta-Hildenbrandia_rubra.ctg4351:499-1335(+)